MEGKTWQPNRRAAQVASTSTPTLANILAASTYRKVCESVVDNSMAKDQNEIGGDCCDQEQPSFRLRSHLAQHQLVQELDVVTRQRDGLAQEVDRLKTECSAKDDMIYALQQQLAAVKQLYQPATSDGKRPEVSSEPCKAQAFRESAPQVSQSRDRTCIPECPPPTVSVESDNGSVSSERTRLCVRDAVEEIQRWMFMEGGHMMGVDEMIAAYSRHVRSLGIPLDRVFISGLMLHPNVSAYIWKWEHKGEEVDDEVESFEMPRDVFAKKKELLSPDEPFIVLLEGRANSVRMQASDSYFPPDCKWFCEQNYQDYLALPMQYRGKFVGAMAWSTKDCEGFSDEDIEFLNRSLAALSTVMRLHTNDLVMKTLMSRLEEEVKDRTRQLAATNQELETANQQIKQHSASQLKHFAMMSHEIRTPLNCIVGMASLLVDTDLSEEQRESVQMISTSGDLLASLVNDVLDYSKLER